MSLETNFWLTVTAKGKLTQSFPKMEGFWLLWNRFGWGGLRLAEKFIQKRGRFFIVVVTTRLFGQAISAITATQYNCRFSVVKRIIQNVAARFASHTIVTPSPLSFPVRT